MLTAALLCGLSAVAAHSADTSAEDDARALVGLELQGRHQNQQLKDGSPCRRLSSGTVFIGGKTFDDWSDGLVECRGRYVLLLEHDLDSGEGESQRYRVVDAVVLPPVQLSLNPPQPGPYLYNSANESCTLDGRHDTLVYAVVRHGKRSRITWRNGLTGAWTFDVQRGSVVPVPPKRVACTQADASD